MFPNVDFLFCIDKQVLQFLYTHIYNYSPIVYVYIYTHIYLPLFKFVVFLISSEIHFDNFLNSMCINYCLIIILLLSLGVGWSQITTMEPRLASNLEPYCASLRTAGIQLCDINRWLV